MNKKNLIILITLTAIIALGWLFYSSSPRSSLKLDSFAQCISGKKATMYGAYWCPHCQAQKKLFGKSFKYVNYVECTQEIKKCQDNMINGYPTWVFEDGSRVEGELTIQQLANKTTCPIL